MQTFLPYPDFAESARALDRQRLGKQRVEVLQILRSLLGVSTGWQSHPAVRMWCGYEASLARYGEAVCAEWLWRGYRDTVREKIQELCIGGPPEDPHWLGDETFHRSHRSNLLRKAPEHYAGQPGFDDVPDDLPYVWPVAESELDTPPLESGRRAERPCADGLEAPALRVEGCALDWACAGIDTPRRESPGRGPLRPGVVIQRGGD